MARNRSGTANWRSRRPPRRQAEPDAAGTGAAASGAGQAREDLVVFWTLNDAVCSECGQGLGRGSLLRLENDRALCPECADLDHLVFLPRGDAALTRRATKHSALRGVVVRFSRARKRYERQGILVTSRTSPHAASRHSSTARSGMGLAQFLAYNVVLQQVAGDAGVCRRPRIIFIRWCYTRRMRRVTVTIPDHLEAKLDALRARQDAPPSVTAVLQAALEAYLQEQELRDRGYRPARVPFRFEPLDEVDDSGEPDVSTKHDQYLAGGVPVER